MKTLPLLITTSAGLALLVSCSPTDSSTDAGNTESQAVVIQATELGSIEKIHQVGDIFLGGQPGADDFAKAKASGIKTIINLRHDDEVPDLNEKEAAESAGLTYVNLPWNGPEELTDEVFDKSRELLKSSEKPVLLHCKSANRVGAVWLPYRVLDGGLTVEDALTEAKTVGLKKAEYEAKAKDYIQRKGS